MVDQIDPKLLEELKEAFDIFDKNNDGTISPNEVKDILKALELCSTEEQVSKMMKEADIDGSGGIEFGEFLQLMTKRYQRRDTSEELRRMFVVFDIDKSGTISQEEIKEVLTKMGESITTKEVEDMIAIADNDGDGEVNYEEFLTLMERIS